MAWLPYERYELTTQLSREQIIQKIEKAASQSGAHIRQGVVFTDDGNTNGFNVKLGDNAIIYLKEPTVIRLGTYTNSFKPEAKILIEDLPQGARVRVLLRPPAFAIVFICIAVCLISAAVIFSKRDQLSLGKHKDVAVAIFCMLVMCYMVPVVAFNADLSKIKLFINDLFEGEPEN